jgi:hypothetical protein
MLLGRSAIEATRLRFDKKKSLYSRLQVEPSVRNGAFSHQSDYDAMTTRHESNVVDFFLDLIAVPPPQWENGQSF